MPKKQQLIDVSKLDDHFDSNEMEISVEKNPMRWEAYLRVSAVHGTLLGTGFTKQEALVSLFSKISRYIAKEAVHMDRLGFTPEP